MVQQQKNAIIISLHKDITEIKQLATSLQYQIYEVFIQTRNVPDVASYIGSGKLEEIAEFIKDTKECIDVVIVDGELKPSQWFLLEKSFSTDVYDRIRLILDIFKDRADRKEAKLQVRLAELEYEKPFVRELIHRSRSGEHPGLMAGGEYQVDDYYEMIKKQMRRIRLRLEQIRTERKVIRQHRQKSGFYLISLVGYTNAGKSSLLQALSKETVYIDNKLFSTLSPLTRRVSVEDIPVLLTDTVGFIQRLPSWIIDAFHSTLEEIQEADLVLFVVDATDEISQLSKKIQTSFDELNALQVTNPILIVLNKIDIISLEHLQKTIKHLTEEFHIDEHSIVSISVTENKNLDELLEVMYQHLPNLLYMKLRVPNNSDAQSFLSLLYDKTKVTQVSYTSSLSIELYYNPSMHQIILSECKKLDGVVLQDTATETTP